MANESKKPEENKIKKSALATKPNVSGAAKSNSLKTPKPTAKPASVKPVASKPTVAPITNAKPTVKPTTASAAKSSQIKPVATKNVTTPKASSATIKPTENKPVSTGVIKPTASKPNSAGTVKPTMAKTPEAKQTTANAAKGQKVNAKKLEKNSNKNFKNVDNIGENKLLNEEENFDKKKKRKKWLLLLLLLLLLGGLIVGTIFLIQTQNVSDYKFNIEIESDVTTEIVGPNDEVVTIVYFPGDLIEASMKVKIEDKSGQIANNAEVFLRFKVEVFVEGNYINGLFKPYFSMNTVWNSEGLDGYYYYNGKCKGGSEFKVFDYLDFIGEADNNALNGKSATLRFTVEILEAERTAIDEIWHTAPEKWRNQFGE